ncbi:hypothetical protein CEP53_003392 [Fusarium sp. AF-6]|nr:hypothetical protein CEP53_003392 [Fusarium sp. AF-6]
MSSIAETASARQSKVTAWFAECQQKQKIKTPQEIFQEKHAAQRAVIDQELRSLIGLDPETDVIAVGDRLVQYAGKLKELEEQHAATKEINDRAFAKEVEERHKGFFTSFVDIVGVELVGRWMRELQGEPTPVEEDTPMLEDSDSLLETSGAQERQVHSPKNPVNRDDEARKNQQTAQESNEGTRSNQNQSTPNRERSRDQTTSEHRRHPEERQTPYSSSPRPRQAQPETSSLPSPSQQNGTPAQQQSGPPSSGSHRKRPASPSGERNEEEKRPRVEEEALTQRSIDFDQVFQDGDAEIKYTIARYPRKDGNWYILECKEHGQHFTNDPILGAAKHLATAVHGNLPRKHELAVSILGTLVKNCTPELVENNNEVAQEAFDQGLGIPVSTKRLKRPRFDGGTAEPRAAMPGHPHTRSSQVVSGIMNPQAGEIYAAYWKSSRSFYPVLILPWGSFQDIGFKGSLLDTGLLVDTPSCYVVDGETAEWAEGYEDGGRLVSKRQFPVLYFDELKFPEKSSVGWVHVADLKHFDPNDMSILQRDSVSEFIETQKSQNPDTIVRIGLESPVPRVESDILERGEQLHMGTLTGSPGNENGLDEHEEPRQDLTHQDVFTTPPQETPQPPDSGEQNAVAEANADKATTNEDPIFTANKGVNPPEPATYSGNTNRNDPIIVEDDDSSDPEIEGLMNFQPLNNATDLIASGNDFLRPHSRDSLLDSLLQDKDMGNTATANGTSPTMPINQSVPNQPAPQTSSSRNHCQQPRSEHQIGTSPPVTTIRPVAIAPKPRTTPPATNVSTDKRAPPSITSTRYNAPPPATVTAASNPKRPLAPKPGVSRTQSSPIPASLMPDDDYLQQLAAQAVVSTHSEIFKRSELLPRIQPRPTSSSFATTPRSFEMGPENDRAESVPHQARKSSGFFDAVLGPRAGFVEPNGRPQSASGSPHY